MKALIFIKTNDGKIYYKCDSFWNKSENVKYAKIYQEYDEKEVDNWITTYDYNIHESIKKNPDKLNDIIKIYHNCKMGYRMVEDSLLSDGGFRLRDDIKESNLGEFIYTHQVDINGLERPSIFDIRKRREEKLNEILK